MKRVYTNFEAEKFLEKYIPVSKSQLVKKIKDIKLKTPLVLKIISQDAIHKTEINGVRFVHNMDELIKEFNNLLEISKKKKMKLDGIMIQEFLEGEQLIMGINKSPVFGHVILFGLGGIFTEVLDDISIRKCPISLKDADDMINELKAKKIFYGFRGKKLNTRLLKKVLVNLSRVPLKHKNIQELDINPFMLDSRKGKVVDARIVFS